MFEKGFLQDVRHNHARNPDNFILVQAKESVDSQESRVTNGQSVKIHLARLISYLVSPCICSRPLDSIPSQSPPPSISHSSKLLQGQ